MNRGRASAGRRASRSPLAVVGRLLLLCSCPLLVGPGSLLASGPRTPAWTLAVGLVSLLSLVAVAADGAGLVACNLGVAFPVLFLTQLSILALVNYSVAGPQSNELLVAVSKDAAAAAGAAQGLASMAPAPASALRASAISSAVEVPAVADPPGLPPKPGHSGNSLLSVVLACAEEGEYAVKTALKIFDRTPSHLLKEIIVVDDGSQTSMASVFNSHGIGPSQQVEKKIRIIRHPETLGLMVAKKTGGDAAVGDIIVFFDCHVSTQPNWHVEIIRLIEENPKRMVVPGITDLDLDTWEEKPNSAVNTKCYLTWQAEFDWFDDEDPYVPVMSGGLLALSRYWWHLTGGYDNNMRGWGGENLDQSLRSWLCGGEIMRAKSSRVAHMWRVGNDMRTRVRYRSIGSAQTNKLRVVVAWYGVFRIKFDGREHKDELDTSSINAVQRKMGCKPLVHFLHRFRDVYVAGAVIPTRVFQLKHRSTGLCLAKRGNTMYVDSCGPGGPTGSQDQLFHWANRLRERGAGGEYRCCTGLRHWGSDACLDYADGSGVHTYPCDITGSNQNQQYHYVNGRVLHDSRCLAREGNSAVLKSCSELSDAETLWDEVLPFEPIESRLYKEQLLAEGLRDPAYPT